MGGGPHGTERGNQITIVFRRQRLFAADRVCPKIISAWVDYAPLIKTLSVAPQRSFESGCCYNFRTLQPICTHLEALHHQVWSMHAQSHKPGVEAVVETIQLGL